MYETSGRRSNKHHRKKRQFVLKWQQWQHLNGCMGCDLKEEIEGGEQDVVSPAGNQRVRGEGRPQRSWTHTNISLSQSSTPLHIIGIVDTDLPCGQLTLSGKAAHLTFTYNELNRNLRPRGLETLTGKEDKDRGKRNHTELQRVLVQKSLSKTHVGQFV